MPSELIALVGGPLHNQLVMNLYPGEPRLKFRTREIDEKSYVMSVYERSEVTDYQEYRYQRDITLHVESLAAEGEDLWLLEQFPDGYRGFGADVGAYDGVATSNTLLLEQKGWTILCVEPIPEQAAVCAQNRKLVEACACGSEHDDLAPFHVHTDAPGSYSALKPTLDHKIWHPAPDDRWDTIRVPVRRLDDLLLQHGFPRLDVLSVDTEGTEADVLRGIELERWNPKCVVVESWDHPGEVGHYLAEHGYRFVERREPNDLYVRP